MNQVRSKRARSVNGFDPNWDVAYLFPGKGQWTEDDFFALDTNRLVELSKGCLEVLPMPTMSHQLLVLYLYRLLHAFVTRHDLGLVLVAALPVRLWEGEIREPDVVFMHKEHADRMDNKAWDRADLVMEVVSGSAKDRRRDLKEKREEYALAGIPEYWIVDPREETITVLTLAGSEYAVHGKFAKGDTATSSLLPGFAVDVTEALAQQLPFATQGKRAARSKDRRRKKE